MALDPNGKYLRQMTTGNIFGWDEEFAKRGDMVPYHPGNDAPAVEIATIDMRRAALRPEPVEDADQPPQLAESTPGAPEAQDRFGQRSGVFGAIFGEN